MFLLIHFLIAGAFPARTAPALRSSLQIAHQADSIPGMARHQVAADTSNEVLDGRFPKRLHAADVTPATPAGRGGQHVA
jgi:hypothetical protein